MGRVPRLGMEAKASGEAALARRLLSLYPVRVG
jgi:hypothetical protein